MQSLIVVFLAIAALTIAKPYHGYEQPDYTLEKYQPKVSNFNNERFIRVVFHRQKYLNCLP